MWSPALTFAADLALSPVRLTLPPSEDRAALQMTNQGSEAVRMQIEPVSWTQVDGQDRYEPTRELMVNPPIFVVEPGQSQVIRVGLRGKPGRQHERAYRLIMREVPAAAAGEDQAANAVRVLLQLRVPVYISPAQVSMDAKWRADALPDGRLAVTVENAGNVHLVVSRLSIKDGAGNELLPAEQISVPVFAGQRYTWTRKPTRTWNGRKLTLGVSTEQGPQDVPVELGLP